MIHRTPFILPFLYPSLVWRIPSGKKELYLTFDDGPTSGTTEFVLEVLRKYAIRASFFCLGAKVIKHPEIVEKIVAFGHAIGNHTFNHPDGWNTNAKEYLADVNLCANELLVVNDQWSTNLFRPPYGRITRSQIKQLQGKYTIVMWDVLTRDYDPSLSAEKCLKASLKVVRDGSIIVFHDTVKAERNLTYALPRFVEECLNRGFTFETLA